MQIPAGTSESDLAARLDRLTIETPSWGYADTGTRFGKFVQAAAAGTIEEKLADAAEVHRWTGCCPSVAVHVLWDLGPGTDAKAVGTLAERHGVRIGSINPNVFQDQAYKLGSVSNVDPAIRRRAIAHLLECVRLGEAVGSECLSLWFADGTNYPGQGHIRQRKRWFEEALAEVHAAMPASMTMLLEYKPFEPAFYHTDIADWGMACTLARRAGPRAKVLVDTGHHLPGCNVEHIVAFLIDEGMLGGFHFNDRKYADDDLTMGSIDPYQLFRIFAEIVLAESERNGISGGGTGNVGGTGTAGDLPVAYMIDQSHNIKPKIEAMIQTVMTAQEHFVKAMLVDRRAAEAARNRGDVVLAERALREAFATDVRGFVGEYRTARGLAADPLLAYRESGYEARVAAERGGRRGSGGTYA